MSAVELIRAAIDRLEQQQEAATGGQWRAVPHEDGAEIVAPWRNPRTGELFPDVPIIDAGDYAQSSGSVSPEDADLVVTLHRTIDPQLAILRAGIAAHSPGDDTTEEIEVLALDLARAILGRDTE